MAAAAPPPPVPPPPPPPQRRIINGVVEDEPLPISRAVLPGPQDKYTTYDFTPFLSAPAVREQVSRNRGAIPLISPIPPTRLPSPLATNIHPAVIEDIHDFLLGVGKYSNQNVQNNQGIGREVWASWKRAWDIWNNHYIEGRVNEVWVAETYKKLEKWERSRAHRPRRTRGKKRSGCGGPYRTEVMAFDDLVQQEGTRWNAEYTRDMAETHLAALLEQHRGDGPRYVEFCELLSKYHFGNHGAPQFEQYDGLPDPPFGIGYVPLTEERALAHCERDHGRQERGKLRRTLIANRNRGPGYIEFSVAWRDWFRDRSRSRYEGDPPNYEDFMARLPREESHRGRMAQLYRDDPASKTLLEERVAINRPKGVGYIELSIAEVRRARSVEGLEENLQRLLLRSEPEPIEDNYIDCEYPGAPADDSQQETDSDPEPMNSDATLPFSIEADGSSGGFYAMKDFDEYYAPSTNDNRFFEVYDPTENSVWRPKRPAEKELKIDMDEDTDVFLKETDLEFDGGVDCGRSPYPLLRPLIRYAKRQVLVEGRDPPRLHLFNIKKTWDGVTGTIFNMPIVTNTNLDLPIDKRARRLYGHRTDFDPEMNGVENQRSSHINPDVFPLDIRRVTKLESELERDDEPGDAERNRETIIQPSFKEKQKEISEMHENDPWWVTDAQRRVRDIPPRTYPLRVTEDDSWLPQDVKSWEKETDKDSNYKNRYFVTNLDGRLLMINGLQVRKGEIAGPLPEFAVIQYEGGGVAFWFGVGGRYYQEPSGNETWQREWQKLRRKGAEWQNIGLSAGVVWRKKILRKIRENDEGAGEQDEQWIRWKNARPAPRTAAGRGRRGRHAQGTRVGGGGGGHDSDSDDDDDDDDEGAPGPLPFRNLQNELKWVNTQYSYDRRRSGDPLVKAGLIEPTNESAWGGLPNDYRYPLENPTDAERTAWWNVNAARVRENQRIATRAFNASVRREIEALTGAAQARALKRIEASDGYFLPDAKRIRTALQQRTRELRTEYRRSQADVRLVNTLLACRVPVDDDQVLRALGELLPPNAESLDSIMHLIPGAITKLAEREQRGRLVWNPERMRVIAANPDIVNQIWIRMQTEPQTLPDAEHTSDGIRERVGAAAFQNALNVNRRIKQDQLAADRQRGRAGFLRTTATEQQRLNRAAEIRRKWASIELILKERRVCQKACMDARGKVLALRDRANDPRLLVDEHMRSKHTRELGRAIQRQEEADRAFADKIASTSRAKELGITADDIRAQFWPHVATMKGFHMAVDIVLERRKIDNLKERIQAMHLSANPDQAPLDDAGVRREMEAYLREWYDYTPERGDLEQWYLRSVKDNLEEMHIDFDRIDSSLSKHLKAPFQSYWEAEEYYIRHLVPDDEVDWESMLVAAEQRPINRQAKTLPSGHILNILDW